MLIDTHAHLHHEGLIDQVEEVLTRAKSAGVTTIINVGVTEADSRRCVELVQNYEQMFATVGLHPHDAEFDHPPTALKTLDELAVHPKVIAIGECGLDYFNPAQEPDQGPAFKRERQEPVFRGQIELALKHNLPMVWHVRDAFRQAQVVDGEVQGIALGADGNNAFDDFFEIVDQYQGLRGIVHCFTSTRQNLDKAVERGFYVALNGIMTFTKDPAQLEVARTVPLDNLVLETDCPFLAPVPMRGKTNEPAFIRHTAEFLADLRGETFAQLSAATTANAKALFGIG